MPKSVFVSDLLPETGSITTVFRASQVERKMASNGKPYLDLTLRDRTGEVKAKFWNVPADVECKPGSVVRVAAQTETFRDVLQLKVFSLDIVPPEEVQLEDFIPASKRDRDEMMAALESYIGLIQRRDLRAVLTSALIADTSTALLLRDCPAARKVHQAYLGGLLEHLLNLCSLAVDVCATYPSLDRDVLLAGAIVHDVGKLWELSYFEDIGSTRPGQLLGHIIQGSIWWDRISAGLDQETREHIAHIIASHHGQLEWGAAVQPMSREAQMFHLLDMIDSRMAIMSEALESQPADANGFTPRVYPLGVPVLHWKDARPVAEALEKAA